MRSSRLAGHGVRDPLQREPHSYFAKPVNDGPCTVGKDAPQFGGLTGVWLRRLFSLVLFESLD
jgi:hypothetical protein